MIYCQYPFCRIARKRRGTLPPSGRRNLSGKAGLVAKFGMDDPSLPAHLSPEKRAALLEDLRRTDREVESLLGYSGAEPDDSGAAGDAMRPPAGLFASAPLEAIYLSNQGRNEEAAAMVEGCQIQEEVLFFEARHTILVNTGRLEDALALCDRLLEAESDPFYVVTKANVLLGMGRIGECSRLCDRWAEWFPLDPELLAVRARVAALSGGPKGAGRLAMLVLRVGRFPSHAYVALAEAVLARGDPAGAVKILNRAMHEDPHLTIAHVRKAEILAGMGRLEEAARSCRWRLVAAPGDRLLRETRDRIEAEMG